MDNYFEFFFSLISPPVVQTNAKGGFIMFFTILAYSITIIGILAYFFFSIFPCEMILGPRLGRGDKYRTRRRKAIAGRKWEKEAFGIRDILFWLE